MAKEDFCFTYYDGDAARDMSHMTRLQRGAYGDIISAIRKFGHISLDQARMILPIDDASGADVIDAAIGDVVGEFATGEEPFAHAVKRRLKR